MSGGGFFGGGELHTQDNGGAAKRAVRPVRALMISQVLSAGLEYDNPDGPVVIDSNPVANAVLCVELLDVSESSKRAKTDQDDGSFNAQVSKRLKVGDATGTLEVRLPPYSNVQASDYEEHYNQFGNMYGHFRIFEKKIYFDFTRFEFDVHPYQFLYHEIEAARESYHYQGLVTLDKSLSSVSEDPKKSSNVKGEVEQPMFVANFSEENDMKERILGIIKGNEDLGDVATTEYIASELSLDVNQLLGILYSLENEAKVYEIENCWRTN